jgi:hypothetical protein
MIDGLSRIDSDLVEGMVNSARSTMGGGQQLWPVALVRRGASTSFAALAFGSQGAKAASIEWLRSFARGADLVIVISEAMVKKVSTGALLSGRVDAAGAERHITVSVETRSESLFGIAKIVESEASREFGAMVWNRGGEGGIMSRLLDRDRPSTS